MKCPKCNSNIHAENINVRTDIAQCIQCEYLFKLSENLDSTIDEKFNINDPPAGAWYEKSINSIVIGATTRSSIAFFLVPFMVVWSGGSIGALYFTQFLKGEFNLFQSLFGIPFILASIFFWSYTLMTIWGKVELTLDNKGGKIFTGIGKIGLVKKFVWNDITTIKEKPTSSRYPGSYKSNLVLEGKRSISFGLGVKEERRYYLFMAIKSLMHKNKWYINIP